MKKVILLSIAAVVSFAACQKEISPAQQETKGITMLTASVEQHIGDTKTALGTSNTVVWSTDDAIKVWNVTSNDKTDFTLTDGAGTTQGEFLGDEIENPQYAFYPASAVTEVSGENVTFTLPATQTYAANTFGNGANIAVAQISGSSMQFKNVCGVLKLQLKGTTLVKSITVTGKNNEKLNGTYVVNASAATPDMPCATTATESEKSVTLDCGGGVLLDPSTLKNFYIVVPKGALASGLKVTVNDFYSASEDVETNKSNVINRNVILSMPEKNINIKGKIGIKDFSISSNETVRFSMGCLIATVDDGGNPISWRFSSNQYDCLKNGGANKKIGIEGGDVDVFSVSSDGYGAGEGWKPWGINSSNDPADYLGNFVDWGTNELLKATLGDGWFTLTDAQWTYLFGTRLASTVGETMNARYANVLVEGQKGVIIFPDAFAWNEETMGPVPEVINHSIDTWNGYNYNLSQFEKMEAEGVIFSPCNGYKNGANTYSGAGVEGGFCVAASSTAGGRYNFLKYHPTVDASIRDDNAYFGRLVRLVMNVNGMK